MRVLLACVFLLSGCGSIDAFENARSPAEAYHMLNKENGVDSVNPYDHDPKYAQVYCTVDKVEFRTTAAACAEANGIAIPTN